jgi:hypothetical protein
MKIEYENWISVNVPDYESAYGHCQEVCQNMLKIFPELILAKGFYEDPIIGDRQHWWLKTEKGEIIDPTVKQFPSMGMFPYRELTENDILPKGRCMNCGALSYYHSCACCEECDKELEKIYG